MKKFSSGIGAGSCFAPFATQSISSTSWEYCIYGCLLVIFRFVSVLLYTFFSLPTTEKTKNTPAALSGTAYWARARPDSCSCALFPLNFPGV